MINDFLDLVDLNVENYIYPELTKSDGVSDRITVVTNKGSYSELFELGNQPY